MRQRQQAAPSLIGAQSGYGKGQAAQSRGGTGSSSARLASRPASCADNPGVQPKRAPPPARCARARGRAGVRFARQAAATDAAALVSAGPSTGSFGAESGRHRPSHRFRVPALIPSPGVDSESRRRFRVPALIPSPGGRDSEPRRPERSPAGPRGMPITARRARRISPILTPPPPTSLSISLSPSLSLHLSLHLSQGSDRRCTESSEERRLSGAGHDPGS